MVGNDVVDLCDRDADMATYRGGFDARVFTWDEQMQIDKASESSHQRWRLWAAKEASYKLARRLDSKTIFAPRKFEVQPDVTDAQVMVIHNDARYFVGFTESSRHIHAVAVCDPSEFQFVIAGVELVKSMNSKDESAAVRAFACGAIAERLAVPRTSLEFRKNARIPQLFIGNEPAGLSVSFSHHGAWIAFACYDASTCQQGEMRVA
jgi:phosphopantetheinyl transferase (holo-ACP synthase)